MTPVRVGEATRRLGGVAAVALVVTMSGGAWAEEPDGGVAPAIDAGTTEPAPPDPPPDQASGILVPEPAGARSALWVPRVLLFVPRWAYEFVLDPLRLGAWAYDRYQLRERIYRLFFNETGTFGIYPLGFFETGFGLNVGARLVAEDLFGHGEKLRLGASFGGEFAQRYSFRMTSGTLLGDKVNVQIRTNFQIVPKSQFFGIGNSLLQPITVMLPPIEALGDSTAVPTRFGQTLAWEAVTLEVKPRKWLTSQLTTAAVYRSFGNSDNLESPPEYRQTSDVYDTHTLVGWDKGLNSIYTELALTLDTLSVLSPFHSMASPSAGWKVTGFTGYNGGFADDPSNYVHYGVDALRYINLYRGDRVLLLRAYVDAVTGPLDQIPFTDLPRLGGPQILRGYHHDRFRDRIALLGTGEYEFPIGEIMSGFLFLDAGRVERSWDDLSADRIRYGFGGGIQLQSVDAFIMRFQVAGSVDEPGVFIKLSFDPLYNPRPRATEKLSW